MELVQMYVQALRRMIVMGTDSPEDLLNMERDWLIYALDCVANELESDHPAKDTIRAVREAMPPPVYENAVRRFTAFDTEAHDTASKQP